MRTPLLRRRYHCSGRSGGRNPYCLLVGRHRCPYRFRSGLRDILSSIVCLWLRGSGIFRGELIRLRRWMVRCMIGRLGLALFQGGCGSLLAGRRRLCEERHREERYQPAGDLSL